MSVETPVTVTPVAPAPTKIKAVAPGAPSIVIDLLMLNQEYPVLFNATTCPPALVTQMAAAKVRQGAVCRQPDPVFPSLPVPLTNVRKFWPCAMKGEVIINAAAPSTVSIDLVLFISCLLL